MTGIDRDQLVRDLQKRILKVEFTKKDGENRIMECTLNMGKIEAADRVPKGAVDVAEAAKSADTPIIRVLDTQLGEWRAITFANITSVETIETLV